MRRDGIPPAVYNPRRAFEQPIPVTSAPENLKLEHFDMAEEDAALFEQLFVPEREQFDMNGEFEQQNGEGDPLDINADIRQRDAQQHQEESDGRIEEMNNSGKQCESTESKASSDESDDDEVIFSSTPPKPILATKDNLVKRENDPFSGDIPFSEVITKFNTLHVSISYISLLI